MSPGGGPRRAPFGADSHVGGPLAGSDADSRASCRQRTTPDGSTRESLDDETAIIVPLPPTTSAAMRYWNMARQRLLGAEFTRAYVERHGSHASERETDGEGGSLLLAI